MPFSGPISLLPVNELAAHFQEKREAVFHPDMRESNEMESSR